MNTFIEEVKKRIAITDTILKNIKTKYKALKEIGSSELEFTIGGKPKPQARPRKGKYCFYVPGAGALKKEVRKAITEQLPPEFKKVETQITIDILCFVPTPKAFSKVDTYLAEKGLIRPTLKPDVDNLEKTYMDCLTSIIWYDDCQIVDGRCRKYYSIEPRTVITIRYKNGFTSAYLKSALQGTLAYKKQVEKDKKAAERAAKKKKKGATKNGKRKS